MSAKSILLADDLASVSNSGRSRSHLLRDLAAEFSRRLNLPLRILYVANTQKAFLSKALQEKIKKKDKDSLMLLGKEMSHYPVKTKIISTEGEPVSGILKQEEKNAPLEMIVLGSLGKHGLKKAIIGSVSEEVLRRSTTPILILGPYARLIQFELPMDEPLRILLLTDLSSASAPAEQYAASLASRLQARLTVCYSVGHRIHQLKEMISSRRVSSQSIDAMFKDMQRDGEKLLLKKTQQLEKLNNSVESLLLKDEKNLEDVVSKKMGDAFDLIVMGTHSRNKFLTAFIGSSARNLILKSPVPVIICRSQPD
ncbi:universal stress protein [Bdellovibrio sp. BCCA]|uniref:universal stress protein n=1 Tax=Bdellovibrio sp. BCCA TaxID=3136281 RepID=UPI0030F2B979